MDTRLINPASEAMEQELFNLDAYIIELLRAETLSQKASAFYDIACTYRRVYGEDSELWIPWAVHCRDVLVEYSKTKLLSDLLVVVQTDLGQHAFYNKDYALALECAQLALEYSSLCFDDGFFLPKSIAKAYKLIGASYSALGNTAKAKEYYRQREHILDCLRYVDCPLNYCRHIVENCMEEFLLQSHAKTDN